ncbi:MAG: GAF domain-containing protein [Algicola sp.]|nr:GAF domain-containing protein [Algicola sp.]
MKQLSVNQGLAKAHVNRLLVDHAGFLWLATKGGLNRYDGYEIITIKGPDGIFVGTEIPYIFQDSVGLMWISHANSGLYTLDLTTNKYTKRLDENLLGKPAEVRLVDAIVEQDNGDLWMASTQNLRLFHRETGRIEVAFSLTGRGSKIDIIRSLLLEGEHLYIATSFGLYVMNINSRQFKKIPHSPHAQPNEGQANTKSLYLVDNQLWVGTVEGLYSLDVTNIQAVIEGSQQPPIPVERINSRNIWRIMHYENMFYIGTDEGLYRYDYSTHIAEKEWAYSDDKKFAITDNHIRDIVTDSRGNLWLASRMDGAFYWNPYTSTFKTVYRKTNGLNELSDNLVWSLHQTKDGALWAGTQNGLNKIDLATGQVESYLVSDDKKAVRDHGTIYRIMEGENGILWLVTGEFDEILVAFDTKTKTKRTLLLANPQAQKIVAEGGVGYYLDEQGFVWFANRDGFYRYDTAKGTVNELTGLKDAFPPELTTGFLGNLPNRPDSILVSSFGLLWLYDIERNQATQIYAIPGFNPQDYTSVESWVIDKYNILWLVIAGHGLVGLDANTFEVKYQYDQVNKLPNDIIFGPQLDETGDVWLSSHQGIVRLDSATHHLAHFIIKNGLATNEFNGGANINSSTKLDNGQLAFASMKGVTIFDPKRLESQDRKVYQTKISRIELMSRKSELYLGGLNGMQLILNHDDFGLKISHSTLDFNNEAIERFNIRLAGEETIEYQNSNEHSTTFSQLQPGDYTYTVTTFQLSLNKDIKVNSNRLLNEKSSALKITVLPPPWQTWWAYLIYVVVFVILTWIVIFNRISNERKKIQIERAAEMAESYRINNILSKIGTQISATLVPQEIFAISCNRIRELMEVSLFSIGFYQADRQSIEFELVIENNKYLPQQRISMTDKHHPSVWCIEHLEPFIVNDLMRDFPNYFSGSTGLHDKINRKTKSLVYWPLTVGEHIIGVLTIQSHQANAYDENKQNMIRTLAYTIAIALDNATNYRKIEQKNNELIETQQQLVQSEKMASLGVLTAGVAHEINNPTNFVHVSTQNLEVDLSRFEQFLFDLVGDDADEEITDSFRQQFEPLYQHLATIKDGTERIKLIVRDLRAFTQLDSADKKTVFITDCLQSTVNLVQTKYLEVALFVVDFKSRPEMLCYPAQLNQVFMNLIVNACDAIREKQQHQTPPTQGRIVIGCQTTADEVQITVQDNGCGMDEHTQNKLYEPFYTTKEVGEGTGLGLSISYGIVQKHGGRLTVTSQLNEGTTFVLGLPRQDTKSSLEITP